MIFGICDRSLVNSRKSFLDKSKERSVGMSEEEIISRHLQKYVDKMEVWRSKQRYEDHKEKYLTGRKLFERYQARRK